MGFDRHIDGDGYEMLETGILDLDGERIYLGKAEGFGGADLELNGYYFTWEQVDILKQAISEAEKLWRRE